MAILYVGIDLAKNVFAVHGVDEHGKAVLVRPSVARARLHELIAGLPPCTIGMEACSGAHHWARLFQAHGHSVRPIAPKFVVPYRLSGKRGKNDAADAAAICEALQRPSMRFVPLKTEALLSEEHRLDDRIAQYDQLIAQAAREDSRARRLMQLPGIGTTTASALVAMIGNGHDFKHGRQLAAWLGLVPGQYSSGGKARLGHITKAGDPDLRSLLVMGAKALLNAALLKTESVSRWATALAERRGDWRAVVAIAAKNARMAWAVLRRGEDFVMPA